MKRRTRLKAADEKEVKDPSDLVQAPEVKEQPLSKAAEAVAPEKKQAKPSKKGRPDTLADPMKYVVSAPQAVEKVEQLLDLAKEGRPDLEEDIDKILIEVNSLEEKVWGPGKEKPEEGEDSGLVEEDATFEEGQKVEISLQEGNKKGVIKQKNEDGTYQVSTEEGLALSNIPASVLTLVEEGEAGAKEPVKMSLPAAKEGAPQVQGLKAEGETLPEVPEKEPAAGEKDPFAGEEPQELTTALPPLPDEDAVKEALEDLGVEFRHVRHDDEKVTVDVKAHGFRHPKCDALMDQYKVPEHLRDELIQDEWGRAQEQWWEDWTEKGCYRFDQLRELFGFDVKVYSDGRSGGHLILDNVDITDFADQDEEDEDGNANWVLNDKKVQGWLAMAKSATESCSDENIDELMLGQLEIDLEEGQLSGDVLEWWETKDEPKEDEEDEEEDESGEEVRSAFRVVPWIMADKTRQFKLKDLESGKLLSEVYVSTKAAKEASVKASRGKSSSVPRGTSSVEFRANKVVAAAPGLPADPTEDGGFVEVAPPEGVVPEGLETPSAEKKPKDNELPPENSKGSSAFDKLEEIDLGDGYIATKKKKKEGEEDGKKEARIVVTKEGKEEGDYVDAFGDDSPAIIKFFRELLDIKEGEKKDKKDGEKSEKKDEGESVKDKPKALPDVEPKGDKKEKKESKEEELELLSAMKQGETVIAMARSIVMGEAEKGYILADTNDVDNIKLAAARNGKHVSHQEAVDSAFKLAADRREASLLALPVPELLLLRASLPRLAAKPMTIQASKPEGLAALQSLFRVDGAPEDTLSMGAAFSSAYMRLV